MVTTDAHDMIGRCLQDYADGAIAGESARMKRVMHGDAQIFGYLDGQMFAGPMQLLYDYVDAHAGASSMTWTVSLIDESDGVGTAKVLIKNWHGHDFIDYFTFLEIEGEWKIMNKVFAHK